MSVGAPNAAKYPWAWSDDCLLCGAPQPPGHVVVTGPAVIVEGFAGQRRGRVCSKHTLKELILDSDERFMVEITLTTEGVEAIERVIRKKAGARLPVREKT